MDIEQNISISVVIPAYNSGNTIQAALRSVAEQVEDCRLQTEDSRLKSQEYLTTKDAKYTKGGDDRRQIRSVRMEIIVVDDASTDGTAEMVRAWARQRSEGGHSTADRSPQTVDRRLKTEDPSTRAKHGTGRSQQPDNLTTTALRIFVLDKNAGPAAARNRGIAEAKGEWIAFLDADDEWLPGKLALQLRMAEEHPEIDLWCGEEAPMAPQTIDFRPQTHPSPLAAASILRSSELRRTQTEGAAIDSTTGKLFQELSLEDFVVANPVSTITVMVRKSVLEEVGGFDEQFRGPEDYDLWVRIAGRKDETGNLRPEKGIGSESLKSTNEQIANCLNSAGHEPPEVESAPLQVSGFPPRADPPLEDRFQVSACDNSQLRCARMAKLHTPLARYRSESGSLSMDDRKFLPQVLRVLDKAFGEGGALEEYADMKKLALANQYRSASWMAFCRGSRRDAIRLLIKGWVLAQFQVSSFKFQVSGLMRRPWWRMLARYILGRTGHVQ